MTDLDLERLGDVWRQRPDPEELEELKRTAERVRRRARWLQVIDLASAIVVSAVVLWLVLASPEVDTLIVGGGAILVLLLSQIRSRRFRQQELRSLDGSAEQMLDQSIERVRASLKRARSGLVVFVPGMLLGGLVGYVAEPGLGGTIRERIAEQPGLGTLIMIAATVAIVLGFVHLLRSVRRSRRELQRLTTLRDSYRQDQKPGSRD